jgi:hypothetical protein
MLMNGRKQLKFFVLLRKQKKNQDNIITHYTYDNTDMDTILHNIIAYLDLYLKQDICDIVEE